MERHSQKLTPISIVMIAALLLCTPKTIFSADLSLLETAKTNIEQKKFSTAYQLLIDNQGDFPGNAEFDFLLGQAAYHTGDFETAIFAFERVLIAHPESDRARLELARSFYAAGDMKTSRSYFNAVLARDIPETVRQNVESFLSLIEKAVKRHTFGGMVTIGFGYDDNVYSSPADETIRTVLGETLLSGDSAQPKSDLVTQVSFLINHAYRFRTKDRYWSSSLLNHNLFYDDYNDLDLNLIAFTTGPLLNLKKRQLYLPVSAQRLQLDYTRYLTSIDFKPSITWSLNDRASLSFSIGLSSLDYEQSPRDATRGTFSFSPRFKMDNDAHLDFDLHLEINDAKAEEYSYDKISIGTHYTIQPMDKVTLSTGYKYSYVDYKKNEPLFSKPREDRSHEAELGISRVLWEDPLRGQMLLGKLLYRYTHVLSNLELYEYDKHTMTMTLSWLF